MIDSNLPSQRIKVDIGEPAPTCCKISGFKFQHKATQPAAPPVTCMLTNLLVLEMKK